MIRDVTDSGVYLLPLNLLKELYAFLGKVPRSEYDTVGNCKRAGEPIPTNLAEGFVKGAYEKEFKKQIKDLHRLKRRNRCSLQNNYYHYNPV